MDAQWLDVCFLMGSSEETALIIEQSVKLVTGMLRALDKAGGDEMIKVSVLESKFTYKLVQLSHHSKEQWDRKLLTRMLSRIQTPAEFKAFLTHHNALLAVTNLVLQDYPGENIALNIVKELLEKEPNALKTFEEVSLPWVLLSVKESYELSKPATVNHFLAVKLVADHFTGSVKEIADSRLVKFTEDIK